MPSQSVVGFASCSDMVVPRVMEAPADSPGTSVHPRTAPHVFPPGGPLTPLGGPPDGKTENIRSDRAPEGAGAAARGVTGPEGSGGGRGGGGLARPVQRSERWGDRAPVRSGSGVVGGVFVPRTRC